VISLSIGCFINFFKFLAPRRSMVPQEPEIAQPRPRTYLEYVGGLDYGDDDMEGGYEFPPVDMEMETAEAPMTSVQVDGEYFNFSSFYLFSDLFLRRYGCIYASFDAGFDYWHNRRNFQLVHGLE
jgi:hypothetical protein